MRYQQFPVDFTNPGIAWATKWGGTLPGLLKSTDYGETWVNQPYFNSISMWGVHVQPSDGNIILVNSYSTSPGTWRSINGGLSMDTDYNSVFRLSGSFGGFCYTIRCPGKWIL